MTGYSGVKDLLVGSTGFVGGNLAYSHVFSATCHSTDVDEYYGSAPSLCVYAGVPAAMFLANSNPDKDLEIMRQARNNIRKIGPKKLVLISSIAVYAASEGKDENSQLDVNDLLPYGKNRLQLEQWVREDNPEALFVRLPALYGIGLKKNFLYDLHTITPAMLKPSKFNGISKKSELVAQSYTLKENGFYCLHPAVLRDVKKRIKIRNFFEHNDFNALAFTDSRSKYQFYNLSRLWEDINIALEHDLKLINLCTPPLSAKKVYEVVTGKNDWNNEFSENPYDYDLHTFHAHIFGGYNGYILTEEQELTDIKKFMLSWRD